MWEPALVLTPVVVLGAVEEVVRRGLASGLAGRVEVRAAPAGLRDEGLVAYARALGADAVICPRDDVADLGVIEGDVLVLGMATASYDLLVRFGEHVDHVWNPAPASVAALVAGWAMGHQHRCQERT